TSPRGILRRAASFGNWFLSSNALHKSSVRDSCGLPAAPIVTVPQLVTLSLGLVRAGGARPSGEADSVAKKTQADWKKEDYTVALRLNSEAPIQPERASYRENGEITQIMVWSCVSAVEYKSQHELSP